MEGVAMEGALQAMAHRVVEVAIRPKPVLRSSSPISSDLSLCLFVSFLCANQALSVSLSHSVSLTMRTYPATYEYIHLFPRNRSRGNPSMRTSVFPPLLHSFYHLSTFHFPSHYTASPPSLPLVPRLPPPLLCVSIRVSASERSMRPCHVPVRIGLAS